MVQHLFLEGPIRAGKSTFLRHLLRPYMDRVGGFSSQRLLDNQGNTKAFRIGPARGTPLTSPYFALGTPEYTRAEDQGGNGIFRINRDDGSLGKFSQVFRREGVHYLKDTRGKKLLLLDEIGGVEMQEARFRRTLYDILAGPIPCIGVIKLEEKAALMTKTAGYEKSIVSYNRELRRRLTEEYNGKILPFRRDDETMTREVKEFVCGIFTTD